MKLDFDSSTQQTKTELDEKFFSIADPAFIFDLLRNKIYSNPIAAVCRELTCNALDANREVGNADVPIVVNLPNHQEPYFKVKDFGPGISPQRMDDIYLKYAASTKRNSNDQIGAFGIGAKSPFSYSESFTIITNHNGKCYNYAAFIDESRLGKLILLSETDTAEPNGTEVVVPVKTGDFSNFINNVERSTRHWKVKPKVTGGALCYFDVSPTLKGSNWFTAAQRESYYEQKLKAVVGEIEYSLDTVAVKSFADTSVLSMMGSDIYLQFPIGEVSLAANRESIFLDPATKQKIKDALNNVKSELLSIVRQEVESKPNLWEASRFFSDEVGNICRDIGSLGPITWRGIEVKDSLHPEGKYSITEFSRNTRRYSDEWKLHRRSINSIYFGKNRKIVIHDCGAAEVGNRHVKKFFEEDSNLKVAYVVTPAEAGTDNLDIDQFMEDNNFQHLNVEMLSKHNSTIKVRKPNDKIKLIISKFDIGSGSFQMSNLSDVKNDVRQKVICYLSKDSWRNQKHAVKKDKVTMISNRVISSFLNHKKDITLYAVDKEIPESRVREVFPNAIFFEDCLEKAVHEHGEDFLKETLWLKSQASKVVGKVKDLSPQVLAEVKDSNSLFLQFCEYQKEIIVKNQERAKYINFVMSLDYVDFTKYHQEAEQSFAERPDLKEYWSSVEKKYPLIKVVDYYSLGQLLNDVIDYVNMVDSKK